jgi:hypothetical protein
LAYKRWQQIQILQVGIGSIFYNSTSGTFKTVKPGGVTMLELGHLVDNLNTARESPNGGGTSQSSVTVAGGYELQVYAYRNL